MHEVDIATLQTWLDRGDAVLIDVRDADAYASEHIPAAVNIPLGDLQADALPAHAGKKLVVHCGGGTRAGKAAAKLLAEDASLPVYVFKAGMRGWRAAG